VEGKLAASLGESKTANTTNLTYFLLFLYYKQYKKLIEQSNNM